MSALEILIRTVHNLGYVFGAGAALIIVLLNHQMDNHNPELIKHKQAILKWPSQLVWVGLFAMVAVHTYEILLEPTTMHILKAGVIYALLAVGILNVKRLIPRVQELAPEPDEKPTEEFLAAKARMTRASYFMLAMWGLDFILNSIAAPSHHVGHAAMMDLAVLLI